METVAVIFGGRSAEHDVSIVTATKSIIKPLELSGKYHVITIYITKDGSWYSDPKLKDLKLFSSGAIDNFLSKQTPISLQFDGGLRVLKSRLLAGRTKSTKVDLVFPAMHGTFGEDGALMGLLDMAGIPYVGCSTSASALAMNKLNAKQLAEDNHVSVSKYISVTKASINKEPSKVVDMVTKNLNYPVFIKPTHLGSSIGISRAKNEAELRNGLEVAAHYDNQILVEEEVHNLIEVTLPIIGNDNPLPAFLEQPLTKPEDFFDFDSKYLQGGKKGKGAKGSQGYSKIPADLDKDLYDKALETGLNIYKIFGLSGISRVDMLIDTKSRTVYFNEINPLPGGLYSHNWNKKGISNIELVLKLIDYAKERYKSQQALNTTFETSYLKQF